MSGGSHNYLYCREPRDLFDWYGVETLDGMATSLIQHGAVDVARDVLRLKNYIEQALTRVEVMHEMLKDVFKAVEWRDSSDIGEDEMNGRIQRYRDGKSVNP